MKDLITDTSQHIAENSESSGFVKSNCENDHNGRYPVIHAHGHAATPADFECLVNFNYPMSSQLSDQNSDARKNIKNTLKKTEESERVLRKV